MPNLSPKHLILITAALLIGCSGSSLLESPIHAVEDPEMCCGHEETLTREVFVFEDTDGNGLHDPDEAPIANALIIAVGNTHGSPKRQAWRTDQDGRASLTLDTTHIFDVDAIPPCGYDASTPNSVNAYYDDAPLSFGFIPRDPQSGDAVVRFHLWHDLNRDGAQSADEPPIAGEFISPTPVDPTAYSFSEHYWLSGEHMSPHDHVLQTDDQGRAEVNLANSCGSLTVWEPSIAGQNWRTTIITPAATIAPQDDRHNVLTIPYSLGETVIEWGLLAP